MLWQMFCASAFTSAAAGSGWRSDWPCISGYLLGVLKVQVCFKFMRLLWFTQYRVLSSAL